LVMMRKSTSDQSAQWVWEQEHWGWPMPWVPMDPLQNLHVSSTALYCSKHLDSLICQMLWEVQRHLWLPLPLTDLLTVCMQHATQ
jgi:hypothetical protein